MKVCMALGVFEIFFAVHCVEIRVFLILLGLKDLSNLDSVLFGQFSLEVFDINLLFLDKLLLKVFLGLRELDLIVSNEISFLLKQLFCYVILGFALLDFFIFRYKLFCGISESIFVDIETLVIWDPWSSEFILTNVALESDLGAIVNKMVSQFLDWHWIMEFALLVRAAFFDHLTVLAVGENVVQIIKIRIGRLIKLVT